MYWYSEIGGVIKNSYTENGIKIIDKFDLYEVSLVSNVEVYMMVQIQYRHGILTVRGAHRSYYTIRDNVIECGVSNRMGNVLDNYYLELSQYNKDSND